MKSKVKINDWKCKDNHHDERSISTSISKICTKPGNPEKKIIKFNSDSAIINEFVAERVATAFLGEDLVGGSYIERQKSKPATRFLVKEMHEHFIPFSSTNSLPYDFAYNFGGYDITIDDNNSISTKRNFKTKTNINSKTLRGAYDSVILSLLLDDDDTAFGNNFALIKVAGVYKLSRFDFDDAFKFFQRWKIAEFLPMLPDHSKDGPITQSIKDALIELLQSEVKQYYPCHDLLYNGHIVESKVLNKKYLIKAIEKIAKMKPQIFEALDEAYAIIKELYTADEIKNLFDLDKMNCNTNIKELSTDSDILKHRNLSKFCKFNPDSEPIEQVKDFVKFVMNRRFDDLDKIKICTQLESVKNIKIPLDRSIEIISILDQNEIECAKDAVCTFPDGEQLMCAYGSGFFLVERPHLGGLALNGEF